MQCLFVSGRNGSGRMKQGAAAAVLLLSCREASARLQRKEDKSSMPARNKMNSISIATATGNTRMPVFKAKT